MLLNSYEIMWVFVLFDLPTDTRLARSKASKLRTALLNDGFDMMQFSVYMRHSASDANANLHIARVKNIIPDEGKVSIIKITDKQFSRIETFFGKIRKKTAEEPRQLLLF